MASARYHGALRGGGGIAGAMLPGGGYARLALQLGGGGGYVLRMEKERTMIRVPDYAYDIAIDVGLGAVDVGDAVVHSACARVQRAYLLGHRIDRATLELVMAFAE